MRMLTNGNMPHTALIALSRDSVQGNSQFFDHSGRNYRANIDFATDCIEDRQDFLRGGSKKQERRGYYGDASHIAGWPCTAAPRYSRAAACGLGVIPSRRSSCGPGSGPAGSDQPAVQRQQCCHRRPCSASSPACSRHPGGPEWNAARPVSQPVDR